MNAPADPKASTTEGWTVQRILEWTTTFLKQKGVESARLEAELLLAHARKCQRIRLCLRRRAPCRRTLSGRPVTVQ